MPSLQLKIPRKFGELRFVSKRLGSVVSFSAEVLRHFDLHRQGGRSRTEAGGQLFANFSAKEVRVLRATGPNASDRRSWAWFKPDQRKQNNEIRQFFAEELHFVGDWHTHAEREPNPSSWDMESMAECFEKSRHQLKAFIMVIVGQADFPAGLWVSLHDDRKWERLDCEPYQSIVRLTRSE